MPQYECCVCEDLFQFGPHVYDGRKVHGWNGLMICRECERINHDGVVPNPQLISRIEATGAKVTFNAAGIIVIPP